jgi:CDP-diacylglycerol--glycerol-3-phosphate 3-phosphatidyltransferase
LNGLGVSPNCITILGLLISVTGAIFVGMGHIFTGGILFLLGGCMDLFDGTLARLGGRETKFGNLLDSLSDRIGEAALYLGLVVYGIQHFSGSINLMTYMIVLFVAFISSQMVSYLRAKGESLGIKMREGIMTRPERVILLSIGLLTGENALVIVMGIIGVLSFVTVVSRLWLVWKGLETG